MKSRAVIDASGAEPVITMTCELAAPRAQVWAAFTEPRHVQRWYGGEGFSNPVCEMDVRPGGRWHHVMRLPDGSEVTLDFVFVEVAPPGRLSWQNADHGVADASHPTSLNTLTLTARGRRTHVRFVAQFGSRAGRDLAMTIGFAAVLAEGVDRMADVLANP